MKMKTSSAKLRRLFSIIFVCIFCFYHGIFLCTQSLSWSPMKLFHFKLMKFNTQTVQSHLAFFKQFYVFSSRRISGLDPSIYPFIHPSIHSSTSWRSWSSFSDSRKPANCVLSLAILHKLVKELKLKHNWSSLAARLVSSKLIKSESHDSFQMQIVKKNKNKENVGERK